MVSRREIKKQAPETAIVILFILSSHADKHSLRRPKGLVYGPTSRNQR